MTETSMYRSASSITDSIASRSCVRELGQKAGGEPWDGHTDGTKTAERIVLCYEG